MAHLMMEAVVLDYVEFMVLAVLGPLRILASVVFFAENYGFPGLLICIFGSREIWRIQVQILGSSRDSDTMDFKRSAQDDSNIIAVAVSAHTRDPQDRRTETSIEYNSRPGSDHSTLVRQSKPHTLDCKGIFHLQSCIIYHGCILLD
jgi:hypothetical protein